MLFHGLLASAAYWQTQKVSAMYWHGFRIWQALAESGPLRKGQLHIAGATASFRSTKQIMPMGNLHLIRNAAGLSLYAGLSVGGLHIAGHALNTTPGVNAASGNLHLTGQALSTQQKVPLASRVLNITGQAATFTLSSPTPVPSYANPGGTGNRSGVTIAISTNITFGAGTAANLIDGSQANNCWFNGGQSDRYIIFDFGAGNYKVVSEITWYQDSAAVSQGDWGWDGSHDGTNWIPISTAFQLAPTATAVHALTYANNKGYRYYRLLQIHGTTTSSPFTREIEFKLDAAPQASNSSSVPNYLNPGAQGDRTATITVTSSMTAGSGSSWSNLVDGGFQQNSTDSVEFPNSASSPTITFDFGVGVSKKIIGYAWWASTANNHGSWKMRGSNDNATWTDTSATETLGGNYRVVSTNGSANTTGYRYYQLIQTSGSTTSTPWNQEIQFEIAA